jgi:hypothetical protein
LAAALLKATGMKTSIAAAALALLCSFAASAGTLNRSFHVGAVVVASASVSSRVMRLASGQAIDVQTGGHRAPRPAVLIDGKPVVADPGNGLQAPIAGDAVVTLLY